MAEFGTAIRKGGPATQPSDSTSSSASNPDYNPKQWWRYSDGVREVIGESIAYIYAKFFFYPSASLSDNEPARANPASH